MSDDGEAPAAAASTDHAQSNLLPEFRGQAPLDVVVQPSDAAQPLRFARSDTEFVRRHPGGGMELDLTAAQLKEQRSVSWDLIKQIGRNILEGRDLVSISMPVRLFEPRSFLQRLCDGWVFAPLYLSTAAKAADPLTRMKLVITFAVTQLHLSATDRKPFNPILGETYQASFDDGSQVFMEQTTHHPPASNWEVIAADKSWHYWGRGVWSASFRGNTVKGNQKGWNHVDFADGHRISFTIPQVHVHGIMMGERYVDFHGTMDFVDEANDLHCELQMNPDRKGFVKSLFKRAETPTDWFRGVITKGPAKTGQELCAVEGSWLGFVDIDGVRYFDVRDAPRARHIPADNHLPSDARNRRDLIELLKGDLDMAQKVKEIMEEAQRYDRKLREKNLKKVAKLLKQRAKAHK